MRNNCPISNAWSNTSRVCLKMYRHGQPCAVNCRTFLFVLCLSEYNMKELQTFGMTLMNHVRNDAKTSIDAVQSAFATWQQKEQERTQNVQEAYETYVNEHEKPRIEREIAYVTYLQEKAIAYNEISQVPTAQKKQKIVQWLRVPLPDIVKDGVNTDLIYTSNRL